MGIDTDDDGSEDGCKDSKTRLGQTNTSRDGREQNEPKESFSGRDTHIMQIKRSLIDKQKGYPTRSIGNGQMEPWLSPFVLIIDGGECFFVQKINNSIKNVDHNYVNKFMITVGLDGKQKKTYSVIYVVLS